MLDAALTEKGISHQFVDYPGVDHGVGLGIGLVCEDWIEKAVAFWQAQKM